MANGRWVEPVVLEGERVRLEPLSREHLPGLVEAGADRAIWSWMYRPGDTPDAMASIVDEALAQAESGSEVPFVTIDRNSGRVAGSTRFLAIVPQHRRLEIGWTWLGVSWQRTSVNSEAKLLQLEHAFERLGAQRVELKTDALNARSRTALLGIGATFEGVFRRHMIMSDGRWRDSAWYSVIAEEWPEVRSRLIARLERFGLNTR